MQLYHIPWIRTISAYAVAIALFFFYGQSKFYRDPGSIFFDENRAYERRYSAHRQAEVENFRDELSQYGRHTVAVKADMPSICASFVSVKRQGSQYLPVAVTSAVHRLSDCERQDLYINILLAHTNISEHPSYSLPWLPDLVDDLHGYNVSEEQLKILQELERERDFSTKAVYDYIYALNSCYNTEANWIIIFEDDVLLADGWFIRTKQALRTIHDQFGMSESHWLFLRLFNQERSIGWGSHTIGGNNEVPISLAIAMLVYGILSVLRTRYEKCRSLFDGGSIVVICIIWIPSFVVLFFQSGKASMLPPRPGVRKEGFGCCSQGLVFPRIQVPRITEYLASRKHGQIDNMLDELAVEDSLDRFALYPVQLQHIGQRSVRGTIAREAQAIWSMAFEDQNPRELHESHLQGINTIFGNGCTVE